MQLFSFTFSRTSIIAMYCGVFMVGMANVVKITCSLVAMTHPEAMMSVIYCTEGIGMVILCGAMLRGHTHSNGAYEVMPNDEKELGRIAKECQIPHAKSFPASSH